MLTDTDKKKDFVLEVHRRLCAIYGSQIKYFHDLDPLSELVSALLSHRTTNSNSAKAYAKLVETFGSWESVRDAPTAIVQEAIISCTWPEQKAPRLQNILRIITELRGSLSLNFLADMEVSAARQWLETLPGVGPKTSAAVMSFSILREKALPVDSHHFRVATRLGIIEAKIGEAKAHHVLEHLLPPEFTAQDVYDNHQVMMKHGKKYVIINNLIVSTAHC
jgi:endonuclease III